MNKHALNATLGIVAREARRKSAQSLLDVGKQIGCNRQNVSHLELGEQGWSVARFVAYARAVNASPTHLLRTALLRLDGKPRELDAQEDEQQGAAS
jgi:transcriptional regulator with XRE-family HTH domain